MNEALFFLVALLFIWMGVTVRENMRLERRVTALEEREIAAKKYTESLTRTILQLSTQITERKQ